MASRNGNVPLSELLERIRTRLRGVNVDTAFSSYDKNHNSSLDKYLSKIITTTYEFSAALNSLGIPVNKTEFDELMRHFDKNGDGTLDLNEFVVAISAPLPPSRAAIVLRAFRTTDTHNDGKVTIEGLVARYNSPRHPQVLRGIKTAAQATNELAQAFEDMGDDIVTLAEFQQFYSNISMNYTTDAQFEKYMQDLWGPF